MSISFHSFNLNKQLLNAVEEINYSIPTVIQQKAIPVILGGQHVLGIAQTGTGKTAAYILPLLKILNFPQFNEPRVLIVVPTRELSLQVVDMINQLGKYTGLRSVALFGGSGSKIQIEQLQQGCDIITATPGRLMELYLDGHLSLKKIKHFVLDEAERLMDSGFKPQLYKILEVLPRKRQNLLFSATFSDRVKKIADDFLEFPVIINVAPQIKTAISVTQEVYHVPNYATKVNVLFYLLRNKNIFTKIIVFCKTKAIATSVFNLLSQQEDPESIKLIHGNKTQQARINSMNAFRNEPIRILITTDIAARGLDIPKVSHVINFDVPLVYEDYIHRIGRTGRAFESGASITFCTDAEIYHLKKIQKLIGNKIPVSEMPYEIVVEETPYDESQQMAREIDTQRKKEDPAYIGAFQEKKHKKSKRKRRIRP